MEQITHSLLGHHHYYYSTYLPTVVLHRPIRVCINLPPQNGVRTFFGAKRALAWKMMSRSLSRGKKDQRCLWSFC
jgi:hypothetical protein